MTKMTVVVVVVVVVEKLFYSSWTMKHNLLPEANTTHMLESIDASLIRNLGCHCRSLKMIRNKLCLLVFFSWAFLMITALTEFSMTDSRTAEYS